MSFEFGYKDPKEMSAFKIISEGDGYFKITEAKEGFSKAGNPQLVVTHRLWNDKGENTLWTQYIAANEYAPENIWRILEAAGRTDLYHESGKINAYDLLGLSGKCKIKTEVSKDPQFSDKSRVGKFIPYKSRDEGEPVTNQAATMTDFDDPLPF